MQHATTINAINLFQNDIFNTFGVPPFLHSDNGRQFISKELKELLSLYGIQHKTTGFYKYSQQANASERTNREIISKLRFFLKNESEHLSWDKSVPHILFVLRSDYHCSIDCSSLRNHSIQG